MAYFWRQHDTIKHGCSIRSMPRIWMPRIQIPGNWQPKRSSIQIAQYSCILSGIPFQDCFGNSHCHSSFIKNRAMKLKQSSTKEKIKRNVYLRMESAYAPHDHSGSLGGLIGIKESEKTCKYDKCSKICTVQSDLKVIRKHVEEDDVNVIQHSLI
ncbi:hypothetical protein POM88_044255 [Heracleum sosnowskyi]|uniref:Uncharacterized protein n=1 Tax=Heracleum sosnowskyi TaxID=360622 RepID=A0AAD8H3G1_9APIA|nr:hypothetical protein POM88_044255 [Heracleum sosnowskyi]